MNSSNLASFIANVPVHRSYIIQTNATKIPISVSRRECGLLLRRVNTFVTSGKTSHVYHADFLSPRNADTVSHPVKAWKKGIPTAPIPRFFKYHVLEAIGSLYSYQNLSIISLILTSEMLQLLELSHLCRAADSHLFTAICSCMFDMK